MDPDDDDPGPGLGALFAEWARGHWVFVGSLAAMAVLLLVPSVWHLDIHVNSRGGMSSRMSLGARGLWLAGIGSALYGISGLGGPHHWRMRPPTDGELAVARWLLRALGLVTLWVAFYLTLP